MATFNEFKEKVLFALLSVVAAMMWYDIKEMKGDIKTLIIENAETKSRLINLERQVYKSSMYKVPIPIDRTPVAQMHNLYAILNKEDEDSNQPL